MNPPEKIFLTSEDVKILGLNKDVVAPCGKDIETFEYHLAQWHDAKTDPPKENQPKMECEIIELKQYIRDMHILASEMRIYCNCEASEQVVFEFRQLEKNISEKYKGLLCL